MILATWFYSSPLGENFSYPSVGNNSSDESFQTCYFKCVIDFFASSYVNNIELLNSGSLRHIFYCNKIPSYVDACSFYILMRILRVEIRDFKPVKIPKFSKELDLVFGSVFSQLDVLEALALDIDDNDFVYLLDNDVIVNKSLKYRQDDYLNNPVVLKQQSGDLKQFIQGNSLSSLMLISEKITRNINLKAYRSYVHTGGELVAMSGASLKKFSDMCNLIYKENNLLQSNSEDFYQTEEQIFSCAYTCFQSIYFCNYINRIWTDASKYRTVDGSENELTFLHIPSEKRSGFQKLSEQTHACIDNDVLDFEKLRLVFDFENIKQVCNL